MKSMDSDPQGTEEPTADAGPSVSATARLSEDNLAKVILDRLLEGGRLELVSSRSVPDLRSRLAHELQRLDLSSDEALSETAERLLEMLVDSDAVAEVYADPEELIALLRTR